MAAKKSRTGRLAGKKSAEPPEAAPKLSLDKPNVAPNKRPRGRLAAWKIVSDGGSKGTLDALRTRHDAALKAKVGTDSPAALPTSEPAVTVSTPVGAAKTRTSSSTRSKTALPTLRARTPVRPLDTDEDLYGLSPDGEASRIRLEVRRQSTQPQPPPSALKAQGTPAVETSILALTNFKRRPRQPSIIRMVQQTSEGGNQSDVEDSLRDLDDTLRDFDAFNPDDESTPLHLSKRQLGSISMSKSQRHSALVTQPSSSRKRKHDDDADDEIQVPRSSPPFVSSTTRNVRRIVVLSDSESTASSSLPEVVIPSTEQAQGSEANREQYSDTMAPPLSSSDVSSPPRPQITTTARQDKRRKASTKPDRRDPKEATTSRKKRQKKAHAISTEALQSLLPRSRNQKRTTAKTSTYDIPSSDSIEANQFSIEVDSDGDELAQPSRNRRGTVVTARTPTGKADGNKGRKKKTVLKSAAPTHASLAVVTKKERRRTYGRSQANKENEETLLISDNETNSEDEDGGWLSKERDSGIGLTSSKELEAARKKFEEVDQWEMEFESVDLGGGQSSAVWR
jgi:hypothetical protein